MVSELKKSLRMNTALPEDTMFFTENNTFWMGHGVSHSFITAFCSFCDLFSVYKCLYSETVQEIRFLDLNDSDFREIQKRRKET